MVMSGQAFPAFHMLPGKILWLCQDWPSMYPTCCQGRFCGYVRTGLQCIPHVARENFVVMSGLAFNASHMSPGKTLWLCQDWPSIHPTCLGRFWVMSGKAFNVSHTLPGKILWLCEDRLSLHTTCCQEKTLNL